MPAAIRRRTCRADGERYSQDRARDDIRSVLDALKIDKAHIVGLSMGGFATLHFGFTYPDRARSLVIAGCGYGAAPAERQKFAEEAERSAEQFEKLGMAKASETYADRADAGAIPEQGPAGVEGIRRATGRAFVRRGGADHARRAEAPALAVRPRGEDADHHRAEP